MTRDNDKAVSRQDALREVLELLGKSTPGPWAYQRSTSDTCDFEVIDADGNGIAGEYGIRDLETAAAIPAAVNWLRAHGPALLSGGGDAVAWCQIEEGQVVALSFNSSEDTGCTTPLYLAATPAPAAINPPLADSKTIGAPGVEREAVGAIFKRGKMRHFSQATTPEEIERFHKDNPAGWEFDGWLYTAPTFNDHIEAIRAKLVAMAENWRAGRYLDGTKTLWDAGAHASDGMEACADNVDEFLSTAITTPPAEAREPVGDAVDKAHRALIACIETIRMADTATGVCMCGGSVEDHGFGDGHGPVDSGHYMAGEVEKQARAAIAALAQPRDTPRDSGDAEDAARYRWLRNAAKTTDFACPRWTVARESGGMGRTYRGAELDAAIDAAMQFPTGEPSNG